MPGSLDRWLLLAERTQAAAAALPPLPDFAEVALLERDSLFRVLGYTFWNRELLDALAARLLGEGALRWVELAAGTGRWAVELARRGVWVAATDDYSQAPQQLRSYQRAVEYGPWVERLSARDAVAELVPEAVLCAWPPLGSGLVPELIAGRLPGSERLRMVVCIGEPGGATEAPVSSAELSQGWGLETWPECEPYLVGFNDMPDACWSNSRLMVYRKIPRGLR